MSHKSEWQPEAGKLLEKIVEELAFKQPDEEGESADQEDKIAFGLTALQRAVGPIFETFTAQENGYTATQTKGQAMFLFSLISELMSLVAAGFDARIEDQALNAETDMSLDMLISRFGSEEYPDSVKHMLAIGKEIELQAILSNAMKNAAAEQGDKFFDMVAESAIRRSMASSQTINIMSMFHRLVEVLITENRRHISTPRGPVETSRIGDNVIQLNFGAQKPAPVKSPSSPALAK